MTVEHTLPLPRLAGSREAARRAVEKLGDIRNAIVILDGRELQSAAGSYADETVEAVLVDGDAAALVVKNSTAEFEQYLRESVAHHGISADRVDFLDLTRP
ncbi:hypothetical protein [Aeromicrobium piscarium]|uniref:Uncharacterized protein n=1 Tax=Aeromicrobium piscarium TaxID=2590901 RepID=A0A554S743_9ACTN|nr:hypothetical protein [Aeromicrobium piscarium]TSD62174.1 hypothetical protein FNM00_12510 [Aeromicrobium piscarium]